MTILIMPSSEDTETSCFLWDNLLNMNTLTASTESVDGAALNAVDENTFDYWKPTSVPATLTVQRGFSREANCAGFAAHTLGSFGSTVLIQTSDDGVVWVTEATCTPSDDSAILIFFPLVSSVWWRVRVTGSVAVIGTAFIGKKLVMPTTPLSGHTSLHNSISIETMNNTTSGGHLRGNRVTRRGAETNINFGAVSSDFAESNNFQNFKTHFNEARPFFYSGSALHYPKDIGLCWRTEGSSEIRPNYIEAGLLSEIQMSVSSYVDI